MERAVMAMLVVTFMGTLALAMASVAIGEISDRWGFRVLIASTVGAVMFFCELMAVALAVIFAQ